MKDIGQIFKNLIIQNFGLVREGYKNIDKLIILIYAITTPLLYIIKDMGFKPNLKEFISDVIIKNNNGLFFCSNSVNYAKIVSKDTEKSIDKYIWLKDGVFVDIGANIGKYTIKMSKMLKQKGKVIAIEPEPSNLKILKKNILLNNLVRYNNLIVKAVACSDKEGIFNLYLNKEHEGSHSLSRKTENKIKVKLEKLDSIIKKLKLKRVDLIKIDVEGAELEVLKGAKNTIKKYKPKIIFECQSPKSMETVQNILELIGYNIKKIDNENYLAL